MLAFVRRTLAPLVAGGLAAGVVVAVADADVLPFSGSLIQATDEPATTDSTVPADELDLDELIEAGTQFDFGSVFVDLGPVGSYEGLYRYGAEKVTENVAAELELVVPGRDDPDGGGPIVTERQAAERFLLDRRCNGLVAMAMRKQVSRPILAHVLRPDEEMITTGTGGAVETNPLGFPHVLPLESVVEVGRVTASVVDLDLLRARPAELLADFVAGEPSLADLAAESEITPDTAGSPEFFEAVWTSCLAEAAEEGSVPVPQTLAGVPVWSLKRDPSPDVTVDPETPDIDTVTWLEDGLEIRVESTFAGVDDDITVDPLLDLDTRTWLEHFADTVEPSLEVAARLVARSVDELDLLEREAFAPIQGFEYSQEIAGSSPLVGDMLRDRETALATALSQDAADGAAAEAAPDEDAESTADHILGAWARALVDPGAADDSLRSLLATPPNPFNSSPSPEAFVQAVVWDPELLNSDAFRAGWREGILENSHTASDLRDADLVRLQPGEPESLDVVAAVVSQAEGTFRLDYLLPCYSVTISALDRGVLARAADLVLDAQKRARDAEFGLLPEDLVTPPAPGEPADVFSPPLDDLDHDYPLAALKARRQRLAERAAAEREERAAADARRAAFCSSSNLREHVGGYPVEDA